MRDVSVLLVGYRKASSPRPLSYILDIPPSRYYSIYKAYKA